MILKYDVIVIGSGPGGHPKIINFSAEKFVLVHVDKCTGWKYNDRAIDCIKELDKE